MAQLASRYDSALQDPSLEGPAGLTRYGLLVSKRRIFSLSSTLKAGLELWYSAPGYGDCISIKASHPSSKSRSRLLQQHGDRDGARGFHWLRTHLLPEQLFRDAC